MAITGSEAVTLKQLKTWGDEKLGEVAGRGAVCELTLSGDGTTTVPVGSVVTVAYANEPGVRVSASWADLVSDCGTATQSVDFYLVSNTSASIAVKGPSVEVPGVIV